jgi:hypothetical protein
VDDGVAAFRGARQGFRVEQIRVARFASSFLYGEFGFRAAHLPNNGMASRYQLAHDAPPQDTRCPGDEDFHRAAPDFIFVAEPRALGARPI